MQRPMNEALTGGCRCGEIRYSVESAIRNSICHCRDCQRSAGAPLVEWMLAEESALAVTGEPAEFESSPGALRSFCGRCGTGLFYRNAAIFPGQVDIQTATLDRPDAAPPPGAQVQLAERRASIARLESIPGFERYPE
jgi:hypothetical protein